MEYIKHIFSDALFVDELLMDFIVGKIRDSKGTLHEKEKNEMIVRALFDYLEDRARSVKEICLELGEGNEEDRKIATTLKRLSIEL